ncbi:MAG: hypothetical protein EXR72_23640 [Myxococcales bacterium]|nr:hypothetical protein [Myxococcales bacterium]
MRPALSSLAALAALLAVLPAVLLPGLAAAEEKLTIAIYAPNAPFDSGDARHSFAARLAAQIQSVAGVKAEPKAYARAADFEAALKANQADFAIVDGIYLAERNAPFPVLAIATTGGDTATRWALFSSLPGGVFELEGKRLALAATGAKDLQFVDNALLDGELLRHFGPRQTAPDVVSAVTAVSLKRADCVFAPEYAGRGLRKVFDAGRLPNPAFVQVRAGLAADLVEKVKKAVLAHAASGTYDGWKAGSPDPYRALAARMAPRTRRMVMAEPPAVPIDLAAALQPSSIEPAQVDLRDQFWGPTGLP